MTGPIPPTAGQIRTTASPSPSFDAVLTEHERDQADARAATAEAERDEARDERDELNQKIHAMRAALGYLPTADPIQCAIQTAEALAEARQRIDALDAEATRWKTRLVHDTARLREHLDRANTERQQLAQELADVTRDRDRLRETMAAIEAVRDSLAHDLDAMTAVARSNKQHVKLLTAIVERVESLTKSTDGDAIDLDAEIPVGEIVRVLNEALNAAPPVRPGSSRRAQEEPGRIDTEWWNRRALISDTLGRALWKRGHVVPLSVRDRCAEAVLAALDADAPQSGQGWDPSSPQWAVIRAAIAWRLWYGGHYDPTVASACNDLAAAVDALPHIGEIPAPEQPTKAPWPSAEEAARLWHNTYEKHVHPDARLPWSEVPEPVRAVMIATAEKMLDFLRRRVGGIPAPKLAQGGPVKPPQRGNRTAVVTIDLADNLGERLKAVVDEAFERGEARLRELLAERPRIEAGGIGFQAERADLPTYSDDAPGTLRSRTP